MSAVCQSCLGEVRGAGHYHPRCLRRLFGVPRVPVIDVELAKLHTFALAMVGTTTLAGVQKKLSVRLDRGATLRVGVDGVSFVLKPPAEPFPNVAQNEHLSMRLAAECGIEVPPNALVPMKDGQLAYVVRRFDRTERGKLHQEDFCQLQRKAPKERYTGSLEQCAETIRQFATEPGVEARRFFRYVLFSWWIGNGDLHLKNLSLLRSEDGFWRLAPAYDLVSTALFIPDDQLALPVGGTRVVRSRKTWLELARVCSLPDRAAKRVIDELVDGLGACLELVGRSSLPDDQKDTYRQVLAARTEVLKAGSPAQESESPGIPDRAMRLREALLAEHPGMTNLIVEPTPEDQPLWDYLVERGHAVHRLGGYALKNWLADLDG